MDTKLIAIAAVVVIVLAVGIYMVTSAPGPTPSDDLIQELSAAEDSLDTTGLELEDFSTEDLLPESF